MLKTESKNFVFIDALRGIAALLVIYFHLHIHIFMGFPDKPILPGTWSYRLILGDFDLGKYAVGTFFLISGFLIPSTLRGRSAGLKRYAVHRLFRLYPAYWVSMIVAIIIMSCIYGASNLFTPENVRNFLLNTTMFQRFVGGTDLIGVYWTLQIEVTFYFLCAALFAMGLLERRFCVIVVMLGLALITAIARAKMHKELPVAMFIAMALMFLGDTLRAYGRGKVTGRWLAVSTGLLALALIPICKIGYAADGWRYVATYYAALVTFGLAWLGRDRFPTSGALWRLFVFFGSISYSLYLLSTPVGLYLGGLIYGRWPNRPLVTLFAFTASTIAAAINYKLVEAPALAMGKRIGRRWETPDKPAEPLPLPGAESSPITPILRGTFEGVKKHG